MFWAGIVDDKLVGLFRVLEGVKKVRKTTLVFLVTTSSIGTIDLTLVIVMSLCSCKILPPRKQSFLQANGFLETSFWTD